MVKKINLFNRFEIKLTNKWLYSFIALGIVLILGVGVYATWANTVTHVGHSWDEIKPCASEGQILKINSAGNWACDSDDVGTGGGASLPSCENGQIIQRCSSVTTGTGIGLGTGTGLVISGTCTDDGWGCADLPSGGTGSVWSGTTDIYYNGGKVGIGTGTTTPGAKLEVGGTETQFGIIGRSNYYPGQPGRAIQGIATGYMGTGIYGSALSSGYGVYSDGNAKVTGNLDVAGRSTLNFCPEGYNLAFGEDEVISGEDSYSSFVTDSTPNDVDTCNGEYTSYTCVSGETKSCKDVRRVTTNYGTRQTKRDIVCNSGFTKKSVYCVSD